MKTIELDLNLDREDEIELEQQYGIKFMVVIANGPPGGNPLYSLYSVQGDSADIVKFLKEWYYGPDFGSETDIMDEIEAAFSELLVS